MWILYRPETCIVWWGSCLRCPLVFPISIRWPGSNPWIGYICLRRRRCKSSQVLLWTYGRRTCNLWSASSCICYVCSRYLGQDQNWDQCVIRWSNKRASRRLPLILSGGVDPLTIPHFPAWLCLTRRWYEFGKSDKIYIHRKSKSKIAHSKTLFFYCRSCFKTLQHLEFLQTCKASR